MRSLLPLKSSKSLSNRQLKTLIQSQGQNIGIASWEIESIIQICGQSNCTSRGLGILREYANLIDKMNDLISKIQSKKVIILNIIVEGAVLSEKLSMEISKYSEMCTKLIVRLCRWRKLQWSPRPFFSTNNIHEGKRLCISRFLTDNATEFYTALTNVKIEIEYFGLHPLLVCFLFTPILSEKALKATLRPIESTFQQKKLRHQRKSIEDSLRTIFTNENKIENMFQSLEQLLENDYSAVYEMQPTLRLPYRGVKPPVETMSFFSKILEENESASSVLHDVINNGLFIQAGKIITIPNREVADNTSSYADAEEAAGRRNSIIVDAEISPTLSETRDLSDLPSMFLPASTTSSTSTSQNPISSDLTTEDVDVVSRMILSLSANLHKSTNNNITPDENSLLIDSNNTSSLSSIENLLNDFHQPRQPGSQKQQDGHTTSSPFHSYRSAIIESEERHHSATAVTNTSTNDKDSSELSNHASMKSGHPALPLETVGKSASMLGHGHGLRHNYSTSNSMQAEDAVQLIDLEDSLPAEEEAVCVTQPLVNNVAVETPYHATPSDVTPSTTNPADLGSSPILTPTTPPSSSPKLTKQKSYTSRKPSIVTVTVTAATIGDLTDTPPPCYPKPAMNSSSSVSFEGVEDKNDSHNETLFHRVPSIISPEKDNINEIGSFNYSVVGMLDGQPCIDFDESDNIFPHSSCEDVIVLTAAAAAPNSEPYSTLTLRDQTILERSESMEDVVVHDERVTVEEKDGNHIDKDNIQQSTASAVMIGNEENIVHVEEEEEEEEEEREEERSTPISGNSSRWRNGDSMATVKLESAQAVDIPDESDEPEGSDWEDYHPVKSDGKEETSDSLNQQPVAATGPDADADATGACPGPVAPTNTNSEKSEAEMDTTRASDFFSFPLSPSKEDLHSRDSVRTNSPRYGNAAIQIQRVTRGYIQRRLNLKRMAAVHRIINRFRLYMNYKILKRKLRKAERPLKILIRRLVSIPPPVIRSDKVSIRLSVWWSSPKLTGSLAESAVKKLMSSEPADSSTLFGPFSVSQLYDMSQSDGSTSIMSRHLTNNNNSTSIRAGGVNSIRTGGAYKNSIRMKNKVAIPNNNTAAVAVAAGGEADASLASPFTPTLQGNSRKIGTRTELQHVPSTVSMESVGADGPGIMAGKPSGVRVGESLSAANTLSVSRGNTTSNNPPSAVSQTPSMARRASFSFGSCFPFRLPIWAKVNPSQRLPPIPRAAATPATNSRRTIRSTRGGPRAGIRSTPPSMHAVSRYCEFSDVSLFIPGCNGYCIIKVEFIEKERPIADCVLDLGRQDGLFFRGGEFQKDITMIGGTFLKRSGGMQPEDKLPVGETSTMSSTTGSKSGPVLEFAVTCAGPLKSMSIWVSVEIKGSGPLRRKMHTKRGFLTSMLFEKWDSFYCCLDQVTLYLFESNVAADNHWWCALCMADVTAVSDYSHGKPPTTTTATGGGGSGCLHLEILTVHRDHILIRFPTSRDCKLWKSYLTMSWQRAVVTERLGPPAAAAAAAGPTISPNNDISGSVHQYPMVAPSATGSSTVSPLMGNDVPVGLKPGGGGMIRQRSSPGSLTDSNGFAIPLAASIEGINKRKSNSSGLLLPTDSSGSGGGSGSGVGGRPSRSKIGDKKNVERSSMNVDRIPEMNELSTSISRKY